jgi:hypothetical protein
MKNARLILFLSVATQCCFAGNISLKIRNGQPCDRKNMPIVLDLDNYQEITRNERSQLAVFADGEQISSQLDDLDSDGIADELVFLIDLKANETREIKIKPVNDETRKLFPKEVYADLILKDEAGEHVFVKEISSGQNDMYNKLYHHGAAFESSLIAYRIYFDNKSTVDVYGKKKRQLELAETGWYPTGEQLAAGYGDDILRVSGTVGAGTVKGWDGKKAIHIEKFDKRTQRIVAEGNLRCVVESEIAGWEYEGKKIDMTVRYIQYARNRDVHAEIRASENIENLATGVQKIGKDGVLSSSKELAGSWGTDYPVNDTIKYAKETCGLGVMVPEKHLNGQLTERQNNLILMNYKKGDVLTFRLTAVSFKEEECLIKNADDFFEYLEIWRTDILSPIKVE